MKILITLNSCTRCHVEKARLEAAGEPFIHVNATGARGLGDILVAVLAEWSMRDTEPPLEFPLIIADSTDTPSIVADHECEGGVCRIGNAP